MKKGAIILLCLTMSLCSSTKVKGAVQCTNLERATEIVKLVNEQEPELIEMNLTAYYRGTTTATGAQVKEGIAAVSSKNLGKIAIVYSKGENGLPSEIIGIFDCLDTGGAGVKTGHTIDIYRTDLDRCQELMDLVYENNAKGRVFVQFVDAVGEPTASFISHKLKC